MLKLSRSRIVTVAVYLIAILAGVFVTQKIMRSIFFSAVDPGVKESVPFIIERGWNLKTIAHALADKGLVRNWWSVYFLGRLKKERLIVDNKLKVRSGEYSLSKSMTPSDILERFIRGDITYHQLTVPEGSNLKDIAQLMVRTTLVSPPEAEKVLYDRALMTKLQVSASSFEGYLFPDTYKFSRPDNAEFIVTTMVQEGDKRRTKEMLSRAIELGMNMHQVLTLASIIEKETGNPTERKKIASVFHNRLRIGMPLQSDPTVIYGMPFFDGNLRKDDLSTPSSYNTYLNTGLPPTPICSPGLDSVNAALYPDETDYLYFVSRNDGTSQFSATYKEHQEAVRKYQPKRKTATREPVANVKPESGEEKSKRQADLDAVLSE